MMDVNTTDGYEDNAKSMCSNCNECLSSEAKLLTFETLNNISKETGEFQIWGAIAYVYGINTVSFEDYKFNFKKDNQEEENIMDGEEDSLGMCTLCLSLLSDTYKAFKQFESLTHQASFIKKVQNSNRRLDNCKKVEPSIKSVSNSFLFPSLSPSNNVNEDLVDLFNFENKQHLLDDEPDDYFTEESKYIYESADDLFATDSQTLPLKDSPCKEDKKSETSVTKMSFSKQLIVKMEKISDDDLEYYKRNKKLKINFAAPAVQHKTSKRRRTPTELLLGSVSKRPASRIPKVSAKGNSLSSAQQTDIVKRKIKPLQKLQYDIKVIKRKYSSKQCIKKEPLTPKDKRKYECNICGKRYANRVHLRLKHMPIHFQDVSCKMCNKQYSSVYELRKHMKLVHKQASEEELKKFLTTCKICGKTLRPNSLKQHMETHGSRETLKCNKCDKEYVNKIAYEEHLLTHSKNYTPYLCRHCGTTLNDKNSLYIHERRHTEGKKLSCDVCSKKFFDRTNLEVHLLTHSNERSFVCDECGITYKHKSQLRRHQKIHKEFAEKGEYSCKCKYCGRLFKHSGSLRLHLQSHEKTFECSFCGKKLFNATSLRKHENLHKNNPEYKPRKPKTWKSDLPYQINPTSSSSNVEK